MKFQIFNTAMNTAMGIRKQMSFDATILLTVADSLKIN